MNTGCRTNIEWVEIHTMFMEMFMDYHAVSGDNINVIHLNWMNWLQNNLKYYVYKKNEYPNFKATIYSGFHSH